MLCVTKATVPCSEANHQDIIGAHTVGKSGKRFLVNVINAVWSPEGGGEYICLIHCRRAGITVLPMESYFLLWGDERFATKQLSRHVVCLDYYYCLICESFHSSPSTKNYNAYCGVEYLLVVHWIIRGGNTIRGGIFMTITTRVVSVSWLLFSSGYYSGTCSMGILVRSWTA